MVRPLAASLLLAALAGCATGDGMHNKLQDASSGYNRYVRWGDLDRAAEYLPVEARGEFMTRHEELKDDLVIVEYEITRLTLNKEKGTATSRAHIQWHTDRRLIVEETQVEQLWQWHEGNWVLVDERRVGGTPLSAFAEPEEQPHPYLPGLARYRKAHEIGEENKPDRKSKRRNAKHKRARVSAARSRPEPSGSGG